MAWLAMAFCTVWAAWPMSEVAFRIVNTDPLDAPDLSQMDAPFANGVVGSATEPFDEDAFRVPLWVIAPPPPAPPPPPPAPAPAKPLPPLKMQLIAITRAGGTTTVDSATGAYTAILYDPDRDCMLSAELGTVISPGRTVEAISASTLTIREAQVGSNPKSKSGMTRILRLREETPSLPTSGLEGWVP